MAKSSKKLVATNKTIVKSYDAVLADVSALLEQARHGVARSINAILSTTYWKIGQRLVDVEQAGKNRAGYGEQLLERLSGDLTNRFGRGFGVDNLQRMRSFYQAWPSAKIYAILSRKLANSDDANISDDTLSAPEKPTTVTPGFPLPWSHYVKLMAVKNERARDFYEAEALRGGWTIRQLNRQIGSQFYERTALSRNKAAMLTKGSQPRPEDKVTIDEEIKDPYVLEFLNLKDEYSESNIEEGLIRHLETFLLELGGDFTFVGRQRRLRVGNTWFRIDLLFYHRRLRCLILIDLKLDEFSHADVGQMNLYLSYARQHWTHADENPPIGLILSANKNAAVAHYALDGLTNKVMTAEYRMILPDIKTITAELKQTLKLLETRKQAKPGRRGRA